MNQLHTEFLALPPYVLLLSRFSHVRLCSTPQMAAHQAPPSLGFSSQELWNGLSFPSPMNESESKVTQSCPTLSNPMDFSLPGSSVRGIFQARVLEWVAIASLCTLYQFSNFNKENVHRSIYIYIYTHCVFQLCIIVYPENSIGGLVAMSFPTLVTPWTVATRLLCS